MTKLKAGDIVEVMVPEDHEFADWNGLKFEVTESKHPSSSLAPFRSRHVRGTVLEGISGKYDAGDDVTWYFLENLSLVSETPQPKDEKYLSPFSGKWT